MMWWMRRKGALIALLGPLLGAMGIVAFLSQRPPEPAPPAPFAVAKVSDVSSTPQVISVVMRRGADRLLQRRASTLGSCPGSIGCPGSTELRPTPVFLVRDEGGGLHAFIGEDPRNGCALEWKTLPSGYNWFIDGVRVQAIFHDICHGSLYDRRGQRIGGPSPWDLNELATAVRDGDLYVDPGKVVVGACPGCQSATR
jgi:Rieske Fe-S protein